MKKSNSSTSNGSLNTVSSVLSYLVGIFYIYKAIQAIRNNTKNLIKDTRRAIKQHLARHRDKKSANRYAAACSKPIQKSRKVHKQRKSLSKLTRPIPLKGKNNNTSIQGTLFPIPTREHREKCTIR